MGRYMTEHDIGMEDLRSLGRAVDTFYDGLGAQGLAEHLRVIASRIESTEGIRAD